MLILSRVCAEFHDDTGTVLFNIQPSMLNLFIDAPESIKQDPLFDMLLSDGSLEAPVDKAIRKKLENDPDKKPEKTETKSSAVPDEGKTPDRKTTEKKAQP